jgi:MFS family permease
MNINRKPNRWLVVMGAILIQLALGALYAWSVFTKLLTDPNGIYQFTATQTAWIFSAGLATFALVMVIAGRWQAKTDAGYGQLGLQFQERHDRTLVCRGCRRCPGLAGQRRNTDGGR